MAQNAIEEIKNLLRKPAPVADCEPDSKIASFYANRTVFVTGATGFIGKVKTLLTRELRINQSLDD